MIDLDVWSDGSVAVVSVVGELDVASAPALRQELLRVVTGTDRVVVDLGGVDFLDSTGLGVLLGALRRARSQGGDLALARPEPHVRKVFEVTRLSEVIDLHDTVEGAVASVGEA